MLSLMSRKSRTEVNVCFQLSEELTWSLGPWCDGCFLVLLTLLMISLSCSLQKWARLSWDVAQLVESVVVPVIQLAVSYLEFY